MAAMYYYYQIVCNKNDSQASLNNMNTNVPRKFTALEMIYYQMSMKCRLVNKHVNIIKMLTELS